MKRVDPQHALKAEVRDVVRAEFPADRYAVLKAARPDLAAELFEWSRPSRTRLPLSASTVGPCTAHALASARLLASTRLLESRDDHRCRLADLSLIGGRY